LDTNRNYTNIGRATGQSSENIQHFMSNSPWIARRVWEQVQADIKATPGLARGGVVILDESADKKAGDESAGAGRQYNGRLGKVDMSQVGVFLAYANLTHPHRPVWAWVDGELFLQEFWFTPEMAEQRQKAGVPDDREFATKVKLGWKTIQRAQANGLPFEALICDSLYGRSKWFRDALTDADIIYMADVPRNTQVYLEKPALGVPERKGKRGRKPTSLQVVNGVESFPVHQIARCDDTEWHRVRVRPTERGELNDPFAARRVWTLREGKEEPVEEWLVVRQEASNRCKYALSNAPADAALSDLAWLKCQRYFVERANQDAKSEAGWDELEARKYRGWKHHLALVILATWFVAQVKWHWGQRYTRDPSLAQQFELEVLPALSMANFRLLLRAAMPLPQPTPEEAVAQVIEGLVNRTRSRRSRMGRQRSTCNATAPP
jgi:SRSO17 transposase